MNTHSAKAKGRRLQQETRDLLLEKTKDIGLVEGDVESVIMSTSGRDIKLSPAAEKVIPFDIECKNQEKLNVWSAINQAEQNNKKEDRIPLVVFRRNHSKTYCVLEFEKLLDLIYRK